ncbi:MAG: nitrogenase molybdenum-iron protein [Clostridiales bacterium]|nr:nitrogenase molybdenum-iron protein [Clostridiales bacterium]
MKGLRKVLTPFAPDQSGAVGVLYDSAALIVIIDAGGCTGNICGFDEPRWQDTAAGIFSAGLRDMDAILGRDELLVKKIVKAHEAGEYKFSALVGTPVPAVIATDYNALTYMIERKTGKPCVAVPSNGMRLYDKGASDAYVRLVEKFAKDERPFDENTVGIFGALPLDMGRSSRDKVFEYYKNQGYGNVRMYGCGASLEDVMDASSNSLNVAVSSSGIDVVKKLCGKFGTEYKIEDPAVFDLVIPEGRTLVVHDEVAGYSIRNNTESDVTVATFFTLHDELKQEGDLILTEEDEFTKLVMNGGFDNLVCDATYLPLIPDYKGRVMILPHYAVSSAGDDS